MKNLIISLVLVTIGQILAYIQLQGQFIWKWAERNTLMMILLGLPISFLLIEYTKKSTDYFGEVWPGRLIGFAVGVIVFAIFSNYFLNEQISTKTLLCLILATAIVLIQLFL